MDAMRIFLAGGAGVLGSRLVPQLTAAGHTVVATTRRPERAPLLAELGAEPAIVDVYDVDGIAAAVATARADVILHELTDLGDSDTDANARLRRIGTAHLVAAARAAGVERMIVQSIVWVFSEGATPATEEEAIIPGSAVDEMERAAAALPHATVLRSGMLYGPGTWYARGGRIAEAVAHGEVDATPAITDFVHVDDVVTGTVQALDWPDGIYHLVDDEPAAGTTWLPIYAAALGAPAPRATPSPEGAPVGRAVSNAKALAAGWTPGRRSWRTGFAEL
jgi:nucleoside-diphosphate-sugar epimerase